MEVLIAGVVAALAGILVGFWLRGASIKTEKALLEQRNRELNEALTSARQSLEQAQTESASRAGFESLAAEREKRLNQLAEERDGLRVDIQAMNHSASASTARIKELEAELRNRDEKLEWLKKAEETLALKFQALSTEILDQKSKIFSEGSQKELGTLLTPLREQIKEFREKVEKVQIESTSGVTELKTLIGTLGNLNEALTAEAHNLATALRRDTKAQGNWGETILRNILENSGLQEGIHYSFQQSFTETDEDGAKTQRRQTDVVVNLPGQRHLIIDSKVSLNAYNDSVNAENDQARTGAIKKHLQSVRNHYDELAGRNYHTLAGIQSPDFVVMFVPIEPAFLLALQSDETIWHDAYSKGVLLSGPTTVLFVIRIVRDLWRQEEQARNVQKVMKRGAELYDKFVGFVSNLESVGGALTNARQAYEEASKQLSTGPGNLVRQVEMLRKLGVAPKTKRQIPARMLEEAELDEPNLALIPETENHPD